jgi:hypothetical protein
LISIGTLFYNAKVRNRYEVRRKKYKALVNKKPRRSSDFNQDDGATGLNDILSSSFFREEAVSKARMNTE